MAALYVAHPSSYEHDTGSHPENAGRLKAIEAAIAEAGDLGLERAEAPTATQEELERVHTAAHIIGIRELCEAGGGMIDLDTSACARSYEAALHAAHRRKGSQIGGSLLTLLCSRASARMQSIAPRLPTIRRNATVWENSVDARISAAHQAASEAGSTDGFMMRAGS